MSRTKKIQEVDNADDSIINSNESFVRTIGEEFFVEEVINGVFLHKGSNIVKVITPTDAVLIINTLKKYLKKQYPSFI